MNTAALALLLQLAVPPATAEPRGAATVAESAAEPGEVLVNANAAYEAGDYPQAIGLYRRLLGSGIENGDLYYNLGNASLRNGELGRAIAAYRRCLRLLPRHRDAQANLEFARKSARDALQPPQPPAVLRTLFFWHYGLGRGELIRLGVMINLLFFVVLGLRLYRRESELLRWSGILLLLLLLATGGSLLVHTLRPSRVAVIVPQEIDVYSGTDVESVVRFKLHAGTEVAASDERDGWVRIRLPSGEGGWIEAAHAELVGG